MCVGYAKLKQNLLRFSQIKSCTILALYVHTTWNKDLVQKTEFLKLI